MTRALLFICMYVCMSRIYYGLANGSDIVLYNHDIITVSSNCASGSFRSQSIQRTCFPVMNTALDNIFVMYVTFVFGVSYPIWNVVQLKKFIVIGAGTFHIVCLFEMFEVSLSLFYGHECDGGLYHLSCCYT